ncbi:NAD(P)/FAD-dependent oxidoreductase [Desulfurococcaceae archaeon MEX13E-LK6-19]|nr:NAD(P)/FAD-dependent oxidoreductase [Desulfurococcaceae archaeon MEX13E-LK6-19]
MGKTRVLIIGAGITGLSIARVLSMYENLDVVVVEKEPDVGWGATKANTAIIHPCHEEDPDKHPLRAKLCLEGHDLWYKWTKELDIPVKWPGELIVATNDEEASALKHYLSLGMRNGVAGVRIVDKEELAALEPNVNPNAIAGLWAPTAGQMSPWEAAVALAENSVSNGARILFETEVKRVVVREKKVVGVETNNGFIEADMVINAAGIHADEISRSAGIDEFTIFPRRGEYVIYDEDVDIKVKRIVHTAPTPKTKGVYVTTTLEGNLLIGPTAEDLPIDAKEEKSTTRNGIKYILEAAKKILKTIPPRTKIIRMFAGLRPEPSTGSFIIKFYEEPWGFINVAGIRSPGLTAAPAIAYYVRDMIAERTSLVEKRKWNPIRRGIKRISRMNQDEKARIVKENPRYGRIICLCKEVSEAEIIEAIKRMKAIGVKTITLDGIKFRTHAMFGRCQGSFCRLRIALLISREQDIPLWKVSFKGSGSEYGVGEVKEVFKEV